MVDHSDSRLQSLRVHSMSQIVCCSVSTHDGGDCVSPDLVEVYPGPPGSAAGNNSLRMGD